MLNSISWTNYIAAIAIVLIVYYLYVGVRYFSTDIRRLISGGGKLQFNTTPVVDGADEDLLVPGERRPEASPFEQTTDEEFSEIELLVEKLKPAIAHAAHEKFTNEQLIQQLRQLLNEYPSLKYSSLRSSINELILSECQKCEAAALSEREVDLLWEEQV